MSVSFQGLGADSLDVNNGLASRLLRAVGYSVSEESSGMMPTDDLLVGAEKAKREGSLVAADLEFLNELVDLAKLIQVSGGDRVTWA